MSRSDKGPQQIGQGLDAALARLQVGIKERHRQRVEAAARPGETYEQTAARLRDEDAEKEQREARAKIERQQAAIAAGKGTKEETKPVPSSVRKPPVGDEQTDFFVPNLYDVGGRDNRHFMDVAPFRLSKDQKRAGEVIRYELSDGYVEVKAGPDGMASVWDYDVVLMAISHMTEAMNRYREGKGDKPGRTFKPHVADILKFARRGDGARQIAEIEGALDRLKGTTLKSVREYKGPNGKIVREVNSEGYINRYKVLSRTDTGRISSVEIEVAQWIYQEVVAGKRPEVLSVHRDYFLITSGIGRALYRLARKAAGKGAAKWSFRTIYERSGSTGEFKDFSRYLRRIIAANDFPEYDLREEKGQSGPQLVMTHRSALALPNEGKGG